MSNDHNAGATSGSQPSLDLAKYTLSTSVEIAHHLAGIAKNGHMVTVFSNKGKTFILTRFLEVDHKAGTLVFDWGADPETNEHLLASERNVFVCSPEGVKTQFVTGQVRRVEWEGQPAFQADLPGQVIKLQRREFFRIQTPVASPVMCHVADYPHKPVDLALFDVSLGGVSMWLPQPGTPGFDIGQQYQRCTLDLKPLGALHIGLEVRHRLAAKLRNGNEAVRIGCSYLGLTPAMETLIQRYVGLLERERRALVG
ncbi:flagellar brake protein [Chromobacterium haemolyticum]|uniref:Flagellar brake protein YcgR n=1 Tax=Chromobacterium rhizoryzae TaxID=1778675 RepID=A0AAD0RU79_9NEIS|nr:flagellar brake protein [Chromobacterium rhizoryzae]PTU69784.1 flagellar brake protein [Chromobacterium haemolyticum]QOD82476.1 flagellar brake protein [Chromobacterium haemolyticum]BBH15115.1 flagellar brake protein YcgR [Chromobacterium haemolyticum]